VGADDGTADGAADVVPDGEADAADGDATGADTTDGGDPAGEDAGDAPADTGDPATFTVLTINLKHPLTGMDDALARLQIVADAIDARQPDLVALQEVIRDGEEPSFAEQLGTMTGYHWVWDYAYSVPFLFDEGIGALSRWPIVWSDSDTLPHQDLVMFTRRILGIRADAPGGELQLFCSHMTTDSDETVKADQALAALTFMRDHPPARPGWFAGDLNAEPDTLAMRFLRGEAEHEGQTGDLRDAWAEANPDQPGYTIPAEAPDRRIDYIYLVPGTGQETAAVTSCEIMFAEPVDGRYASDHLGVLCSFRLE